MAVKGFVGTFEKKDNSQRRMRFVRTADMPVERIPERKTNKAPRQLAEGMELVWDLDAGGYRTFNFNRLVGKLSEVLVEEDELPPVAV